MLDCFFVLLYDAVAIEFLAFTGIVTADVFDNFEETRLRVGEGALTYRRLFKVLG
jgi:hypothetical protein